MKFIGLSFVLLAFGGCVEADSEFGRAAFAEDTFDMEESLRELLVSYDMSMSFSMSLSYAYDSLDDEDEDSPTDGDTSSPGSTPAPTSAFSGSGSSNSTSIPGAPTASPTVEDGDVTEPLTSCFEMDFTADSYPLDIETSREDLSFEVVENGLEDKMRSSLPFCEDLDERRLEDANSGSNYYIGNVDLDGDELGALCTPKVAGNNCFVAALTLKLFGNPTSADIDYILEVVESILESDMDDVLGPENGLEEEEDITESSDSDGDNGSNSSRGSQKMSAGRKAMVSLLTVAAVAVICAFTYRHLKKPKSSDDSDCEGNSEDSPPHTMAVTEDREGERLFSVDV